MLTLATTSMVLPASAQNADRDIKIDWDPHPMMHPVPPQYQNEHAIVLLQKEVRNYEFEGRNTTMYSTVHRIVKVLDRAGVESFNQVYLPVHLGQSRIDSVKARVILPDGTTRDVKYEMVHLTGGGGLFFALDGVAPNAEIELLVKYKYIANYFESIRFQGQYPVLATYFELNYPKEYTFNTKGYHGFPSGEEHMYEGHKQVCIRQDDIPALKKQPYSFYDLYCMRLEYGIDHFTQRGGYQAGDAWTWNTLAHDEYEDHYHFSEADKKATQTFLTSIGVKGGETEGEKIKLIEDGIKTNIVEYWELSGRDARNLDTVIAKKSASEEGVIRLFCACFTMAGVEHELGATSDRTEHQMDVSFVNFAPMDKYVFYFPNSGKYMAPSEPYYRYPEIPWEMLNNKGVFIKTDPEKDFTLGSAVTEAQADIRTIDPGVNLKKDELNVNVVLDKDMNGTMDLNYTFTGYSASDKRTNLAQANEKKRKELIQEMIGFNVDKKPELLEKYDVQNESFSDVYKHKPLVVTAVVHNPDLVENAGSKYLLMAGKLLGDQNGLYTKEARILPIDLNYPQYEVRTITINIPEGYKVTNPEVLRVHSEHNDRDNGNTTAYFNSDYKIEDGKIIVTVTEAYTRLHYSVMEYDRFRQVINAAADFSKVALVLEQDKKAHAKKKIAPAKSAKSTKTVAKK